MGWEKVPHNERKGVRGQKKYLSELEDRRPSKITKQWRFNYHPPCPLLSQRTAANDLAYLQLL